MSDYTKRLNDWLETLAVLFQANTCQYSAATEAQINDNRQRRANELLNLNAKFLSGAVLHAAVLEEVVRALLDAHSAATTAERRAMIRDSGMCLFYHLVNAVTALELLFPATHTVFATCLHALGSAFVADVAAQQPPLVETVLRRQELADLLTPNFTPQCVTSPIFLQMYERISGSVRDGLAPQVGLALLSKIDMDKVERSFSASEVTALLPITFENVIASGSVRGAFFELCKTHFIRCLLHGFPANFCHGLRLALKGCESNSTPPDIFDDLITELGAMMIDYPASGAKYTVSAVTALEACVVISDTFRESRQELGERMVSSWRAYFKSICLLCEFLLFRAFQQTFDCQLPTAKLEDELNRAFDRVVMVFGPLVEPPGSILPPWAAVDSDSANIILDHFVSILYRLHSLYDTYLPPGAHNLEALMWSYYASRLSK
uniref:Epg5-like central TPR repeats domain-containing protein n=1 Tax=Plectus sambesii TaxID=2011161 RepID=A0A914USJ9_9BILA